MFYLSSEDIIHIPHQRSEQVCEISHHMTSDNFKFTAKLYIYHVSATVHVTINQELFTTNCTFIKIP